MNDRKNRRVGADAEGKGKDGHGGETGRFAKRAESKPQVTEKVFDESEAASLATLLLNTLDATKFDARFALRLFSRHSASHQVLSECFHMEAHFGIHFALHLRTACNGA
jgi:hypothetical protein